VPQLERAPLGITQALERAHYVEVWMSPIDDSRYGGDAQNTACVLHLVASCFGPDRIRSRGPGSNPGAPTIGSDGVTAD
jgi:hypothetical protein